MTSFSALLSALVEQKNIQIYPLTQYCSLDRSTMYKYLNGKRLPPPGGIPAGKQSRQNAKAKQNCRKSGEACSLFSEFHLGRLWLHPGISPLYGFRAFIPMKKDGISRDSKRKAAPRES